ncbi:FAD-binding oxidoreductase [Agrobacterium sp. NPDC090283]|uniref:FAD-binding oxidoreductase n=1 Tax=Agrobacterium sp. NPDC090283 TaxID=3363920 RepID=UPI00383AD544
MNRIVAIDRIGLTVTVEASVILDALRAALSEVQRDLPISFGASDSATLGGILATNAGGANVLRSGMAGRMVLGLEVVLADGTVVSELSGLHKDNSGLNWTQLFIGSEGSLGIITRAIMRIETQRRHSATALLALPDADAALRLYTSAVDALGDRLVAFEIMSSDAIRRVETAFNIQSPVSTDAWLVLMETASTSSHLEQDFGEFIEKAFESELCADGAIAANEAQRLAFWRLREILTEAEALSGRSVKHDISVPVSRIPDFLRRGEAALADVASQTGARLAPHIFGHIGDGNLHYNILCDRPEVAGEINSTVHDLVVDCGGSITAEHGVGQYRLSEVYRLVSRTRLDLQERLKAALDPDMRLNPGKLMGRPRS